MTRVVRLGYAADNMKTQARNFAVLLLLLAGLIACTATHSTLPAKGTDVKIGIEGGSVLVHLPARSTTVGVVALHSLAWTNQEPVNQGWSVAADAHDFVGIYPDHGAGSWNAGLCCGTAANNGRDDVTWLTDVITQLKIRYHLKTIYLTGNSTGGMMVERLIAEHPEITQRFAVWGAAPEMPTAGHWNGYGYLYDGVNDRTVPWSGANPAYWLPYSPVIRPVMCTGQYLIGAHLQGILIGNAGHSPVAAWPELAWKALTS